MTSSRLTAGSYPNCFQSRYFIMKSFLQMYDSANEYEKIFITSGFLAVILQWLNTGMKESDEYMAEHIYKIYVRYGL